MEIYLVGGAVRDDLLGLPVTESDYVVVGATDAEMLNLGYRQVGSDFPVFLHPGTSEEYALARTERKVAPGHQGFECRSDPSVTLEEDLKRRDLTINAMARSDKGDLIDPYGGQKDLEHKLLRHVSGAFVEDPLRILRVARFKARFHHLGFTVHPETTALLERMVADGLHRELTPERVLLEVDKALVTRTPSEFFSYLQAIGAAPDLWPEISEASVSRLAVHTAANPEARFALLVMDQDTASINELCQRLRAPRDRLDISCLIAEQGHAWAGLNMLSAESRLELVLNCDGVRKDTRFRKFNAICGELFDPDLSPRWQQIRDTAAAVKASDIDSEVSGPGLGELIRAEQVRRIGEIL